VGDQAVDGASGHGAEGDAADAADAPGAGQAGGADEDTGDRPGDGADEFGVVGGPLLGAAPPAVGAGGGLGLGGFGGLLLLFDGGDPVVVGEDDQGVAVGLGVGAVAAVDPVVGPGGGLVVDRLFAADGVAFGQGVLQQLLGPVLDVVEGSVEVASGGRVVEVFGGYRRDVD